MDTNKRFSPLGPPVIPPPVLGAPLDITFCVFFREDATERHFPETQEQLVTELADVFTKWDERRAIKIVVYDAFGAPQREVWRGDDGQFQQRDLAA